jgi:hypothetical protein
MGHKNMSPEVARVIHACLATAPGFEHLRDEVEALGFFETGRHESDIRWTHAEGHEVFLSYAASQTTCSVWYDGEYEAEVSELAELLTRDGYPAKAHTDQFGTAWAIGDKRLMRLVIKGEQTKPGTGAGFRRWAEKKRLVAKSVYKQRLGAALLVQGN